jgi:hypothetical protein
MPLPFGNAFALVSPYFGNALAFGNAFALVSPYFGNAFAFVLYPTCKAL